jgi:hypothetical protein
LTENYRAKKVACSFSCKYGAVLQRLVRQAKNAYIMLFLFSCRLAAYTYNNKTNSFSFEVKKAYFLLSSFVEVLWDANLPCRFEATAIPQRPCKNFRFSEQKQTLVIGNTEMMQMQTLVVVRYSHWFHTH